MGAALLTTLVACQGNVSKGQSAPATSYGDQGEVMAGAVGEPIFSGTFQKGEYEAAGTFSIHKDGDTTLVQLSEDFATSRSAPDLYLVIGNSPNPIADKRFPYPLDESDYVNVAELASASGAQTYELPASLDLSENNSVVIWCKRFNATMSYAPLEAVQAMQ